MEYRKKTVKDKLKSQRGESLTETLVALLIAALAIVMLAGAITAATSIVRRSKLKLDDYYKANEVIVKFDGTAEKATNAYEATITISDDSSTSDFSVSKKVSCRKNFAFGNTDEKSVVDYKLIKVN